MKLFICILFTSLFSFAQEANNQFVFINLRSHVGFTVVPGPIFGGQIEVGKNHHNFIFDYSYARGDINKAKDPPQAFQFWTSYTTAKDKSHLFLFTYGYANQINDFRLSANAGPVYEYYIDQQIVTTTTPNGAFHHVVANEHNYLGALSVLQAEHQVGLNWGYGVGLKIGYTHDIFTALYFSLAFNY